MFRSVPITLLCAAVAIICGAGFARQSKPVVLKGFDPVLLTQGKQIKGMDSLSEEFGKFKYLFSSEETKAAFDKDRAQYAVQLDGHCLHMHDMDGDPDIYLVHKGKIYLCGADVCLSAVKKNPEAFMTVAKPKTTVAILVFSGVEIIDYTGPWEVFGGAGYKVFTVAAKPGPFKSAMGMTIVPDYTFDNAPPSDILLLPGGAVPTDLPRDNPTIHWIRTRAAATARTMSVCNGAFWLANAGLLDGKDATTTNHWLAPLQQLFPKVRVRRDKRITDNGRILTTGGLTAGIDGALHIVELLEGARNAKALAFGLEYNWQANAHFTPGTMPPVGPTKKGGR